MNCNLIPVAAGATEKSVSIPNRDFDELQLICTRLGMRRYEVSIPNRDFDELQSAHSLESHNKLEFQSLIGILMNCNCT